MDRNLTITAERHDCPTLSDLMFCERSAWMVDGIENATVDLIGESHAIERRYKLTFIESFLSALLTTTRTKR